VSIALYVDGRVELDASLDDVEAATNAALEAARRFASENGARSPRLAWAEER
jgi:hypothetical protein